MPVFKQGEGNAPAWSELEMFEIIDISPGHKRSVFFRGPKERYVVAKGEVVVSIGKTNEIYGKGGILDIPKNVNVSLYSAYGGSVVRLCGNWGEETGGSGLFAVKKTENPENIGDDADYPRNARFDNHYHDCDEYWIIFSGSGKAVSEGKIYDVKAGDCIATGRGHHHDFPFVSENVLAVCFETTLIGLKRQGHLWNHTHGPARPDMKRI
jgi:mannose-6-phosphate isomerase-like protein (cupin superfamily)